MPEPKKEQGILCVLFNSLRRKRDNFLKSTKSCAKAKKHLHFGNLCVMVEQG